MFSSADADDHADILPLTSATIRIAPAPKSGGSNKIMLEETRHQMLTLMRAAITLFGVKLILDAFWALVIATAALRIGSP